MSYWTGENKNKIPVWICGICKNKCLEQKKMLKRKRSDEIEYTQCKRLKLDSNPIKCTDIKPYNKSPNFSKELSLSKSFQKDLLSYYDKIFAQKNEENCKQLVVYNPNIEYQNEYENEYENLDKMEIEFEEVE
jgi:hypothetical protein